MLLQLYLSCRARQQALLLLLLGDLVFLLGAAFTAVFLEPRGRPAFFAITI